MSSKLINKTGTLRLRQRRTLDSRSSTHFHLLALLGTILVSSCSGLLSGISYYDLTTYKNLTDTKPEVLLLYESFTSNAIDSTELRAIRLKLAQIYEYEKGKGEKNQETIRQIQIIRDQFERNVAERLAGGSWSEAHMRNTAENMSDAFDIAIATEALKNKKE